MKKQIPLTFSILALFSCSQEMVTETNESPEMRLFPQKESFLIDRKQ